MISLNRYIFFPAVLLVLLNAIAFTQSPNDQRWDSFVKLHHGRSILPDDELLGPLADLRNPSGEWKGGIDVCESAFNALEKGQVPEELFYEATRFPLKIAFEKVLRNGGLRVIRRYGEPIREDNRLTVPIRVDGSSEPVTGYIYLILSDADKWFIDQWSLDLSGEVKNVVD